MRRLVLAVIVAAAAGGVAAPASAYCDPKYEPLCLNDCILTVDPQHPIKACPR
ncbi:MAG TPA: hypothetical protein VF519_11955 [Mycobacteriales bacterium]|jgi:hypothetical protein